MASWYPDLFVAVRAAIAAAWPEVVEHGIWHEMELGNKVFWNAAAEDALPLAAMGYGLRPSAEYGSDAGAEDGEVRIYYVANDLDATSMDTLVGKLETLRTRLWDTGLTTCGQVLAFPRLEFSADLWTNAHFLRNQRPHISGMLVCQVVVGEIAPS